MRSMILSLVFLFSLSSQAFTDKATWDQLHLLKKSVAATNDPRERVALLQNFSYFLNERLNTIEVPDLSTAQENDPRIEDFRSLNEFEGYLEVIKLPDISSATCEKNRTHIAATSRGDEGTVAPEAQLALQILGALCK